MGLDNTPTSAIVTNLTRLAQKLELVRSLLESNPVSVTSAYRSPQVNAGIGGSSTSAHMTGNAADILVPGYGRPVEVVKALRHRMFELDFDQIILEYPDAPSGGWCHVGFATRPRGQVLIKRAGKPYAQLP